MSKESYKNGGSWWWNDTGKLIIPFICIYPRDSPCLYHRDNQNIISRLIKQSAPSTTFSLYRVSCAQKYNRQRRYGKQMTRSSESF